MNLNYTNQPEYSLQSSLTAELINLYGIPIKLIITEKRNYDYNVFGDFQSIKANKKDIFDLYALPENAEEVDDLGINYSEFGMLNNETVRLFISKEALQEISYQNMTHEDEQQSIPNEDGKKYKKHANDIYINDKEISGQPYHFINSNFRNTPVMSLQSNLVALPNNRLMEITDVQFMVPGINNLFTYKDAKNVYKITLKPYNMKANDDITALNDPNLSNNDIDANLADSYKELTEYFDELTNSNNEQDREAKENINHTTNKPVVEVEDSVFGRF